MRYHKRPYCEYLPVYARLVSSISVKPAPDATVNATATTTPDSHAATPDSNWRLVTIAAYQAVYQATLAGISYDELSGAFRDAVAAAHAERRRNTAVGRISRLLLGNGVDPTTVDRLAGLLYDEACDLADHGDLRRDDTTPIQDRLPNALRRPR